MSYFSRKLKPTVFRTQGEAAFAWAPSSSTLGSKLSHRYLSGSYFLRTCFKYFFVWLVFLKKIVKCCGKKESGIDGMDVVFVLLEALLWQLHACSSAGRCAAAPWPRSPWQPHPSPSPPGAPCGWIFIPLGPRGGLCARGAAGLCWAQAAPARVQPVCGCVTAGLAPGMRLVRVSPCPRCRGSEDGWRKRCVTPGGDGNTPTRRVSAPYKLPWA